MNRNVALRSLRDELRRIDGPTTDYGNWWAKVREANRALVASKQEPFGLEELAKR